LKGYQKVTVMKLEKLETLELFSSNICLPKKNNDDNMFIIDDKIFPTKWQN